MDGNTENGGGTGPTFRTPPYVSYKTFQTLLEEFQTNGLPPQIDRSVLSRFAGGLQGQLMSALKALGLMTDANVPTPRLQEIVAAQQNGTYKEVLERVLRDTYPYVFALDLTNATPAMFAKAFSEATDAKEDVLRKCRTFFLHAAKDAEIALGPRIENAKFPRNRSSPPRKPKAKKEELTANNAAPAQQQQPKITEKALEYRLVDLMGDASGDADVMQAIITVITFLKTREAKKKAADE